MGLSEVGLLALRAFAGGCSVVLFALVGEAVKPKAFSGLFSAAPSVAVVGLIVTALSQGSASASRSATGMMLGAVGMALCCAVAVWAIPKVRALAGTGAAWVAWLLVSFGLYWVVFSVL